ncbi:MAG: histidine--tRNA ligase [Deltaproteobacteria bacterium]|nr:histidine--tRNA ligase [Deltaproteobacteria bacterium]
MSKKKKIQSITGMSDILPDEIPYWQKIEEATKEVFGRYGFSEIRTPLLEDTALFARGIGEGTQVVQKEMYTFEDRGGDMVTLRPEGTASVVRSYIQNSLYAKDAITKLYYKGPMFRYERPQKGRLRQFHQIGAELMGVDSPLADAELVIMLARWVQCLGLKDVVLQVNSLGTVAERAAYLQDLTKQLEAKRDELCEECQERITKNHLRVFDCKNRSCQALCKGFPKLLDSLGEESKAEFNVFCDTLKEAKVEFSINPLIVRGLDYYEKTAFEFTCDALGSQNAFVGGGRYNNLVEELGGPATPAVGFGIGCERVVLIMQAQKAEQDASFQDGIYLIGLDENSFTLCRRLLQDLRDQGVFAEMDYNVKSMKSQMRRANKLRFKYAGIVGEEECKNNTVLLKNLESGEQEAVNVGDLGMSLVSGG